MRKIFREGTHPAWAAFASVYLLATFGLACYWMITESGPVGWLAEWQAEKLFDGEWYPKITTTIVFLALILPLGLLRVLFSLRRAGRA